LGHFYDSRQNLKNNSPSFRFNGFEDGVAILWNKNKYEIVGTKGTMTLPKFDSDGKKMKDKKGKDVLSGQVVLWVKLKPKDTGKEFSGKEFFVITAHLKSGEKTKERPMKIKHAELMAKKINELEGTAPVIFGADFNTNPGSKAFKQFIADAKEANSCAKMTSAYPHTDKTHKTPESVKCIKDFKNDTPATTYKSRAGGSQPGKCQPTAQAIDFIFYSTANTSKKGIWKCNKVLSLVDLYDMRNKGSFGLPNWRYPSDHLMIQAELELCAA